MKHINHITDIRSLPPLPAAFGLTNRPSHKLVKKDQTESSANRGLEDRIVAEDDEASQISREEPSNARSALLDQMIVNSNENSGEAQKEPVAGTPRTTPGWGTSQLSAFRALQKQVERREGGPEEFIPSQQDHSLVSLV